MTTKTTIMALAIILALGTVAARIVLDTPQAFAEMKHSDADAAKMDHSKMDHSDMTHDDMNYAIYKLGDLTIESVVARATVPGAKVGGGYLTITNNGTEADTLIGGETTAAGELQVHEMKMDGDVMKMRQLNEGIVIEAGATVTLKPGGLHIMFMALEAPLAEETSFKATLNFAKSGPLEVEFNVMNAKHFMSNHNH